MQSSLRPEEAYTNFYRVLKIRQVKYSVFVCSKVEERDQKLLEAELHMRNQYKKGLFHQAHKELWTFGLNDEEIPMPLPKFNLECRETNIFLPSMIFNSNSHSNNDDNKSIPGTKGGNNRDSKYSNILYSILLTSIKRKISINLSMKNYVTPFGNASIANPLANHDSKYSELIYIDPQIYSNGDVLISVAVKTTNLVNLSMCVMSPPGTNFNKSSVNNSNYALYLAPSGIRAYFAETSLVDSLTPTPSNNHNLFIMLQLLIGIVFNKKLSEIKWVKLIPDLKHLNGLTPQVSKYLRPVQNQKYVIWPLDLCYVQKGDMFPFPAVNKLSMRDPFDVVDDFVDIYNLSNTIGDIAAQQNSLALNNNSPVPLSSNIPSVLASGDDGNISVDNQPTANKEYENIDEDIANGKIEEAQPSSGSREGLANDPKGSPDAVNNWNDLDEELFGENNEVTDADFNFFDDENDIIMKEDDYKNTETIDPPQQTNNGMENVQQGHLAEGIEREGPKKEQHKEAVVQVKGQEEGKTKAKNETEAQSVKSAQTKAGGAFGNINDSVDESFSDNKLAFDIPKDEMCLPPSPYLYNDPGAPLPINNSPRPSNQSVFSPLKFNPVIKDVVDNKYDKGGKFYVPDENSKKTTSKKPSTGNVAENTLKKPNLSGHNSLEVLNKIIQSPVIKNEDYSIVVHSSDEDLTSDSDSDSQKDDDDDDDDDDEEDYGEDDGDGEDKRAIDYDNMDQNDGRQGGKFVLEDQSINNNADKNELDHLRNKVFGTRSGNAEDRRFIKSNLTELQAEVSSVKHALGDDKFDLESNNNDLNLNNKQMKTDPNIFSDLSDLGEIGNKTEGAHTFPMAVAPQSPSLKALAKMNGNVSSQSPTEELANASRATPPSKTKKPGNIRYHDSSNWVPFLTKTIPLYTIPEKFFYNNPTITENKLSHLLPVLVNFLAFNGSLVEKYVIKNLKLKDELLRYLNECKTLAEPVVHAGVHDDDSEDDAGMDNFENYFDSIDLNETVDENNTPQVESEEEHGNIETAIKGLFSSMKRLQLAEYVGITEDDKDDLISSFITTDNNDFDEPMMNDNDFLDTLVNDHYVKQLQKYFFKLQPPACKVKRMNNDLTIDHVALKLWKTLSLSPLHEQRSFKVLFLVNLPDLTSHKASNVFQVYKDFLSSIIRNYESCGLGSIKGFEGKELQDEIEMYQGGKELFTDNNNNFATVLDNLDSGIFNIGYTGNNIEEYFKESQERLDTLAKLLTYSLSGTLENILLLFSSQFVDLHSVLKSVELYQNFAGQMTRENKKRNCFFQIIPSQFYLQNDLLALPSSKQLTKLSLSLYNGFANHNDELFSKLVQPIPKKVNFSLSTTPASEQLLNDELYVHLAYERSVDKNWCVASWTDQWGRSKKVRSWYCHPIGSLSKNVNKESARKPFEQVANEIWAETMSFFQNHNRKTYLVLTRLGGVILDDELAHWKRLSQKDKLCIFLLTVNSNPRLILNNLKCSFPFNKLFLSLSSGCTGDTAIRNGTHGTSGNPKDESQAHNDLRLNLTNNGNGSYPTTPYMADSPEFLSHTLGSINKGFLNGSAARGSSDVIKISLNDLENGQLGNRDVRLMDLEQEFYGLILKNNIPLSNSSNKITFKTGYLAKPLRNSMDERLLTFEVNLLSYPNFFNSDSLLRDILGQFRNLAAVNDLIGNYSDDISVNERNNSISDEAQESCVSASFSTDSIVPWHILAVQKVLNVVSHIRVE